MSNLGYGTLNQGVLSVLSDCWEIGGLGESLLRVQWSLPAPSGTSGVSQGYHDALDMYCLSVLEPIRVTESWFLWRALS